MMVFKIVKEELKASGVIGSKALLRSTLGNNP